MGTEDSKIHLKRAPRSLLGVVFFRFYVGVGEFEGHSCLSIGMKYGANLATGMGFAEWWGHGAGGCRVPPFATISTESECSATGPFSFRQVPESPSVEFHWSCSVGRLWGSLE